MSVLVLDTSALVSLEVATDHDPDPLVLLTESYGVLVPERVLEELRDVAAHDDVHAQAANAALDQSEAWTVIAVALDEEFPLDDGENAVVTLANEEQADMVLCDEFARLGLVHASLADSRLATTPTLLSVFVRRGLLSPAAARSVLDRIAAARSWEGQAYVERARRLLEDS